MQNWGYFQKLATIRLDCPVTFNAKNYELDDPDVEAVHEIFDELEFRRAKETMAKIFSKDLPETKAAGSSSTSSSTDAGAGQFSLLMLQLLEMLLKQKPQDARP